MASKRSRSRNKTGTEVTRKASNNAGSDHNQDDKANNSAQDSQGQPIRLRKVFTIIIQRLQSLGPILAVLTITLAFWNVDLQLRQSRFERNQRVAEMAVSLGSYWEERLDPDTRRRTYRFILILESLSFSPEKQNAFLQAFLKKENQIQLNPIGANEDLIRLLSPEDSTGNTGGSTVNLSVELSSYRSALVRLLNTMEMIAIVKKHTKEQEALDVIEYAYVSSIKQRYKVLEPFIRAYQQASEPDRDVPAWHLLDLMISESAN